MGLAELRDRFPVLDTCLVQVQALLDPRRVVLAPEDQVLHLAWRTQDRWEMATIDLPPDLCRSGQPLNHQVLGETIADLLLEKGFSLPQVDIELLLPLSSCEWRLLEGAAATALSCGDDLRVLQPELGWALSLQDCYLDILTLPQSDSALVVGTERQLLQAWVDTLQEADLPLRRAEWLLSAAWRSLFDGHAGADQRLVWLVEQQGRWRLLLLRNGFPEVDLSLHALEYPALRDEVLGLVEAWDTEDSLSLGWWVTASSQWKGGWAAEHDPRLGSLRSDAEMSLLDLALIAPRGTGDA